MIKQTVIEQIEITREKNIFVVVLKQVVDGSDILASNIHRITIAPLADIEAQMANESALLVAKGYPAISDEAIASIRAQADVAWEGYVAPIVGGME